MSGTEKNLPERDQMRMASEPHAWPGLITRHSEAESACRDVALAVNAQLASQAEPIFHIVGGREARTVGINRCAVHDGIRSQVAISRGYFNLGLGRTNPRNRLSAGIVLGSHGEQSHRERQESQTASHCCFPCHSLPKQSIHIAPSPHD